jgi:hypothetical protein
MKKAAVMLTAILFFACKTPETAFFLIIQLGDEDLDRSIIQYFVVANPPKDTVGLLKAVEIYNLRTIPVENLKAGKFYNRIFYRETKQLTRNYEEGAPYKNGNPGGLFQLILDGQQIRYHSDDYLLMTWHYGNEDYSWAYSYLTKENRNANKYITERVHNLDEYFINRNK